MFENYKNIRYPVYDNNNNILYDKTITDISISYSIRTIKTKETNIPFYYQEYELSEYESPMEVSSKLYNTPIYYWVLMQINNVINPYTDWYMNNLHLRNYTIKKYKSTIPAFDQFLLLHFENKTNQYILDNIKFKYKNNYISSSEYQDFIYRFNEFEKFRDEETLNIIHHFINIETDEIVNDYYAKIYFNDLSQLPSNVIAVTNYEYEYSINESKKIIKVFDNTQLADFITKYEGLI